VVRHAKGRHQRQRHPPQLTAQLHDQPLNGLGLRQGMKHRRYSIAMVR
jgi:hypothetical protein